MDTKAKYRVVGLMSGTSLDGLDIAHCTFTRNNDGWKFTIDNAATIPYNKKWHTKLSQSHTLAAMDLIQTDVEYGKYLGEQCAAFIKENRLKPDFITSHGHTVFHQPQKGFTLQIGNGNALFSVTNIPVVYDLRSLDVMYGGQGAPLVPAGDKWLFSEYDVCLNLGGIANLSTDIKQRRIAFDVCFVNMGLNFLAAKIGKKFDRNGALSSEGDVNKKLLKSLTNIYSKTRKTRPSLGREIFENQIQSLIDDSSIQVNDRLRTFTEAAAMEIVDTILSIRKNAKVLCTGGGAFNSFLMSRMLELGGDDVTFIIPDDEIVKFKEALVFAFLGVLRVNDQANCFKSVTGASKDSSGGILVGF
jgi:anhydro-N-acetylmuramic acid kinase